MGGRVIASIKEIESLEGDVEPFLNQVGNVFKVFDLQDSGCISYGVECDGQRLLVKHARRGGTNAFGQDVVAALRRAIAFHRAVKHECIPALINHFETKDGPVLVYEWVDGAVLSSPEFPDRRTNPESLYYRFQQLAPAKKLAVLDALYDAHKTIFDAGYIAVDLYFGCIMYDFDGERVHFCDFDEYRPGPFTLEEDRLPGSRSLMAPEEFVKGSLIDQTTNVFTLGKIALVMLCGEEREVCWTAKRDRACWQGPPSLYDVIHRATEEDRALRYPSFGAFFDAWNEAGRG
jgi:serine/threonine-protein kinase